MNSINRCWYGDSLMMLNDTTQREKSLNKSLPTEISAHPNSDNTKFKYAHRQQHRSLRNLYCECIVDGRFQDLIPSEKIEKSAVLNRSCTGHKEEKWLIGLHLNLMSLDQHQLSVCAGAGLALNSFSHVHSVGSVSLGSALVHPLPLVKSPNS